MALPRAPAVKREGIAEVCQSEKIIRRTDTVRHATFNIFINGWPANITVEHHFRGESTVLVFEGKEITLGDGVPLKTLMKQPYKFVFFEQKFKLLIDPD